VNRTGQWGAEEALPGGRGRGGRHRHGGPRQSFPSSRRAGPIRLRQPSRTRRRTSCPASRVGGHQATGDRDAGGRLQGGELGRYRKIGRSRRCREVESGLEMGWSEMGMRGEVEICGGGCGYGGFDSVRARAALG
jgi:hypothetical protein